MNRSPKRVEISNEFPEPPAQIWNNLIDYIKCIQDLACFSAIGTHCRSIAKFLIPQQIPWLILIPQVSNSTNNYILHCLNLLDNQVYKFKFPRYVKRTLVISGLKSQIFGAKDGWVISKSWIFNPFTKEFSSLPRIKMPSTLGIRIHKRFRSATLLRVANTKGKSGLCLFGLRNLPNLKPAQPILVTPKNYNSVTGKSWSLPATKHIVGPSTWDALVYKGCLYELYGNARLCIFDLNHGTSKYITMKFSCTSQVMLRYKGRYLVELEGELYLIIIHGLNNSVRVLKLDLDQIKWGDEQKGILKGELKINFENKIQDIKNYAIFLGKFCSKALLLTDFMMKILRRNCIYGVVPSSPTTIGVFSLQDGSMEPLLSKTISEKYCTAYPSPWLMSVFGEDTLAPGSGEIYAEESDVMNLVENINRLA